MPDNTAAKLPQAKKTKAYKHNILVQPFLKWAGGSAIR
jgi:hypothetical protein